MDDLKSVIRGLEICSAGDVNSNRRACTDCPFYPAGYTGCSAKRLLSAALEIMKALEPRVLTLDEALEADVCWLEISGSDRVPPCRIGGFNDFFSILRFGQAAEVCSKNNYGRLLRCWSARPTDEQRKAAPWPC